MTKFRINKTHIIKPDVKHTLVFILINIIHIKIVIGYEYTFNKFINFLETNQLKFVSFVPNFELTKTSFRKNHLHSTNESKTSKNEARLKTSKKEVVEISKKEKLIKKLNEGGFTNSRYKIDDDELIRWMHGVFRYRSSSSRIKMVLYDFSYNFYPSRNLDWIKNKLHLLTKILLENKDRFVDIIVSVKSYDPSHFSIEERISYMNKRGILLNNDQLEIYKELIEIDNNNWMKTKDLVSKDINDASPFYIFYLIVNEDSNYTLKRQIIKSWSDEYLNGSALNTDIEPQVEVEVFSENINEDALPVKNVLVDTMLELPDIADKLNICFVVDEILINPVDVLVNDDSTKFSNVLPSIKTKSRNDDTYYIEKIHSTYRYRSFTMVDFNKRLSSKFRMPTDDWNKFFEILVSKEILHSINKNTRIFRLNMKNKDDKYLDFDTIFKNIKKYKEVFNKTMIMNAISS